MKRFGVLVAAVLLVALASSTCFAINEGQTEVNLFGTFMNTKADGASDSQNTALLRGGMGYFLKENISVGGDLTLVYSKDSAPNSDAMVMTLLNINAKYHFTPKNILVPYVGIAVGYLSVDAGAGSGATGYDYVGMAGINYFIAENASFNVELNYRKDNVKASGGPDQKSSTFAGLVGLSYYFGK